MTMPKNLVCFLLLFMLCKVIFSQTRYGLKAGLVISAPRLANNLPSPSGPNIESPNAGFYVGGVAGFNVRNHVIIRPELSYLSIRYTETNDRIVILIPIQTRLNYLALNLDVGWQGAVGRGNLQITAGPYLGRGLGGQWKYDGSLGKSSGHMEPGTAPALLGKDRYFNPLDYGVNFCVGYQLNQFIPCLNYLVGLENTQPYYVNNRNLFRDQIVTKNRTLQIGLTYLFRRLKKS